MHTYQIKRAYAVNPATGRPTRQPQGWRLLRDGAPYDWHPTRQEARDARTAAMAADAAAAARAQRGRLQAVLTAALALLAAVVLVLGLPPVQVQAVAAAPTPARMDTVQTVRALGLPADAAFAALFVPNAR